MVLSLVTCEDAVIDYASDIVGVYIVQSAYIDGVSTDYTALPIEDAWIVDINKDNLIYYTNEINQCDTNYNADIREIESVTDTSIIFTDESRLYYTTSSDLLTLSLDDDVLTLESYSDTIPPAVWSDPTLLTNDIYEPDGSFILATRLSAAGATQTHYSAVCDDEDYFVFETLTGTSYVIEIDAATGTKIDLTISLYSVAGDLVGFSDDQSATNVDPLLEWTCPDSSDYYFVVKKYWDYLDPGNSLDDEKGAYTVSVDVTKNLHSSPYSNIYKQRSMPPSTRTPAKFFQH